MRLPSNHLRAHPLTVAGLALFALGAAAALAASPRFDAAERLETARVACGPDGATPFPHWRGYFWSASPNRGGAVVSRGHYPFEVQRRTVVRLAVPGRSTCRITYPGLTLPAELVLGTGFPHRRGSFEPTAPHTIRLFAGDDEVASRELRRGETGWQELRVPLGELAGERRELRLEVELRGRSPRLHAAFLDLRTPARLDALGRLIEASPAAGRMIYWAVNWLLSLGLVLLLWGLVEALGLFGPGSFSRRSLVLMFFAALALLGVLSWELSLQPSHALHFLQQADGFLRGTTAVATHNELGGDRCWFEGLQFAPNPPLVAILMMPAVALLGFKTNDVVFVLVFAAWNFVLVVGLLERLRLAAVSLLRPRDNVLLAFLFCFGTPLVAVSILGQVWMAAQVVSVTATLVAIGFAVAPARPLLAGLALGAGLLARPPVAGHGLLLAAMIAYWIWRERWSWKRLAKEWLLLVAGPIAGLLATAGYNQVRFGDPLESGYRYLGYREMSEHGLFNTRFLAHHARIFFRSLPTVDRTFPYLHFALEGNAIYSSFPAILYAVVPRRVPLLWWAAAATTLLCLTPAMFYAGTGWKQFVFRRLTDAMPALFVWLALGRRRLGWLFWVLVALGFVASLAGVYWVHGPDWNDPPIYYETF